MLYPFILTTLAGLATMLGTIPIFVKIKNKDTIIACACAFASGVMICVSILDLIPESISYLRGSFSPLLVIGFCFLALLVGILVSILMDNYIDRASSGSNLFKVGILSMIAIILHNIPEDCSCYVSQEKYNIGLKFKNYQDNLYYYFGSLFNFYKCYFNSSSIKFLI